MGRALIYAGNPAPQDVLATGSVISFNSTNRRYGTSLVVSGGNITINDEGYYKIIASVTFTPSEEGLATISLYKDGVAIPNATASATVAANAQYSLAIPAVIRQKCNCEENITAVFSGVAASISNASVVVTRE